MNQIESMPVAGKQIRTPVFIVGSPRSGTTLLRVTLNRHPLLAVCGETNYFRRLYGRRQAFGDPGNLQNRTRIVDAYLAIEKVRGLGMDIGQLRERLIMEGASWRAIFATLLQTYADLNGKPLAGEKTPSHALHIDTLCEWFPGCSIIHLVRDPRATVCSLTKVPWATRSALIGAYTWRSFNASASAASHRDNYIRVKYEELVARPDEQIHRICNHVGLDYDETMLQPNPAEVDPRDWVRRAFEEITPSRTAVWQSDFQSWQVAAIETTAGEYMEEFGYERQTSGAAGSSMLRAGLEAFVELGFQTLFRSPYFFYRYFRPTNLADEQKWFARASAMYGRVRLPRAAGVP